MKKKLMTLFFILLGLALFGMDLVFLSPVRLKVREEVIENPKVSEDLQDMIIASFGDVNLKNEKDLEKLEKAVDSIMDYDPDLILFTGDLFDKSSSIRGIREETIRILKKLDGKIGCYAVFGDKDTDYQRSVTEILDEAGFRILKNEALQIAKGKSTFYLSGIENSLNGNPNAVGTLASVNTSRFSLVMVHTPDSFDELPEDKCTYVLSGHSLGGEINLPFASLFERIPGAESYRNGKYERNGATLDITNGVGMGEKKVRLFADAEVVIYKLKSK